MNTLLLPGKTVDEKRLAPPFVTVALQVDPLLISKGEIEQKIKLSIDKIRNDLNLMKGLPDYIAVPAINKLKSILNNLQHNVNKKSVVVFLSPFAEKTYYLNFLVQEKVAVGEPLNMRELIATKSEEIKFLVLSLNTTNSSIYLGEGKKLTLVVYNSIDQIKKRLDATKERFFEHVDNVLTHTLKAYSLPLIVVATQSSLSLFSQISKNRNELIQTLDSPNDVIDVLQIRRLIKPVLMDWGKLKEKYLLMKLNKALAAKAAVTGIYKVSKAIKGKRGRLLMIERDFCYLYHFTDSNDISFATPVSSECSLFVSDAVEDAIERVLAEGGDVEYVNGGVLKEYMRIALIT